MGLEWVEIHEKVNPSTLIFIMPGLTGSAKDK
jgi:hypothetical protein